MSRLLAPSQSISRLQSSGNDVTGPSPTYLVLAGGGREEGWRGLDMRHFLQMPPRGKGMVSHLRGGGLHHWGEKERRDVSQALRDVSRGKGERLETLPSSTWTVDGRLSWKVRNELMGLLWVKKIILGVPSVPSLFYFSARIWGRPEWWLLPEALIENSGVGVGEIRFFFFRFSMELESVKIRDTRSNETVTKLSLQVYDKTLIKQERENGNSNSVSEVSLNWK